jgi:hypothetical protein
MSMVCDLKKDIKCLEESFWWLPGCLYIEDHGDQDPGRKQFITQARKK